MPALEFRFDQMINELQSIHKLAGPLIPAESRSVLKELREELRGFSTSQTESQYNWVISEKRPLRTNQSRGQYERGDRAGRHNVTAEITSKWQISRVPDGLGRRPAKIFTVSGNASTRIRLRDSSTDQQLAMWRFELGADTSPGCYFHVQILGEDEDTQFPSSLPVPRLPSLIFTPAAVLEFALGELFQDEWPKQLLKNQADVARWRKVQSSRFIRLFQWQTECVKEGVSPWISLKFSKPSADLFSRND
jgi:hypothetical protein